MTGEGTIGFDRPFLHNFYFSAGAIVLLLVCSLALIWSRNRSALVYTGLASLIVISVSYIVNIQRWNGARQGFLPYFASDLVKYESLEAGLSAWKVLFLGAMLLTTAGVLGIILKTHNRVQS